MTYLFENSSWYVHESLCWLFSSSNPVVIIKFHVIGPRGRSVTLSPP